MRYVLAGFLLLSSAGASTGAEGIRDPHGSPPSMSTLAQARQCRPLCAADRNPCDPIIFKITDGRCRTSDDR